MDGLQWNPQRITLQYILDGMDLKENFKRFRNSSSGYISKPNVRDFILTKCSGKCVYCGTDKNLQIDHILSVLDCFNQKKFFECNTIENLQVLCAHCNNIKS